MTAPVGASASAPARPAAPVWPVAPVWPAAPTGPRRFQVIFRSLLRHFVATRSNPLLFPFFLAHATTWLDVVAANAPKPCVASAATPTSRHAEIARCRGFRLMGQSF